MTPRSVSSRCHCQLLRSSAGVSRVCSRAEHVFMSHRNRLLVLVKYLSMRTLTRKCWIGQYSCYMYACTLRYILGWFLYWIPCKISPVVSYQFETIWKYIEGISEQCWDEYWDAWVRKCDNCVSFVTAATTAANHWQGIILGLQGTTSHVLSRLSATFSYVRCHQCIRIFKCKGMANFTALLVASCSALSADASVAVSSYAI
jgi:hypothetical protein